MNATLRPAKPPRNRAVPLAATLALVAAVGGAVAFKMFYKKPEAVVEAPPPEATNIVTVAKVEVDLFPGRRNAHGIFYVPVREAQATALAVAAAAAAQTNEVEKAASP